MGQESKYTFIVSGMEEGELFYPETSAMYHVQMRSQDYPTTPMRLNQSFVWGLDFTLMSDQRFRIASLERWINEVYLLAPLSIQSNTRK